MKSLLAAICLVCSVSGAELPADTKIEIRLKTKVSSNASKPHDALEATVIQPVLLGNQCVIPIGATLRGEVVKAEPSAAADQRALLQLDFNQLITKRGKTIALAAKVADVDNGRESVDDSGVIQGIVASESLSNRMDQGLTKLSGRASGLADILQLAKTKLIKTTDSEIVYDSGVEMTLKVTAKETVGPAAVSGMTVKIQAAAAPPGLQQLVNAQPFQTIAEKPPKPSDKTNLMFIGSQEQLTAAFAAAGWLAAAGLTKVSGFETFAAVAEQRSYKEAPMSVLLLENRPADLNYQKQNNTFSKRHHLRVWRRPAQWQGQDVWVASSTHDIGIDFSAENRTFIHKIDPQIDEEKMKVVWDFLATGAVKYWTLVDRPNVPKDGMNATGDKLITDGKMAVIVLGSAPATR
jgi:LssY C-terminus